METRDGDRVGKRYGGPHHRRWSPSHRAMLDDMEQIIWDDLQKLFRADLQELQHKHCRRQSAAMQILSAVNNDDCDHNDEEVVGVDIDLRNDDSDRMLTLSGTPAAMRWTALQRDEPVDKCDIGASISNLLRHEGRRSQTSATREPERNIENLYIDEQRQHELRQRYIDDEAERQRHMREISELRRRHTSSSSPHSDHRRVPPTVAHPFQVALHHLLAIIWICVQLSKKIIIFLLIYVLGFLIMCSVVMPSMVDFYGEITGERILYVHPLENIDWLQGYDKSGNLALVTNFLKVLGIVGTSTTDAFSRAAQNPSLYRTYNNDEQHDGKMRFWTAPGGWDESLVEKYPMMARKVKQASTTPTPRIKPAPSIAEMDGQYARTSAWHTMKHGLVKVPVAVAGQPPVFWFRKYHTEALGCPAGGCNGTRPVRLAPVGM